MVMGLHGVESKKVSEFMGRIARNARRNNCGREKLRGLGKALRRKPRHKAVPSGSSGTLRGGRK